MTKYLQLAIVLSCSACVEVRPHQIKRILLRVWDNDLSYWQLDLLAASIYVGVPLLSLSLLIGAGYLVDWLRKK